MGRRVSERHCLSRPKYRTLCTHDDPFREDIVHCCSVMCSSSTFYRRVNWYLYAVLFRIAYLVGNVIEYVTEPCSKQYPIPRFPSPQFHHVQQKTSCIPPNENRPLDAPRCPRTCISRPLLARLAELGASNKLIGLARLVMCLAEVPFFYMSGPLINRIGTRSVAGLAQAAYAVRFLYYSV